MQKALHKRVGKMAAIRLEHNCTQNFCASCNFTHNALKIEGVRLALVVNLDPHAPLSAQETGNQRPFVAMRFIFFVTAKICAVRKMRKIWLRRKITDVFGIVGVSNSKRILWLLPYKFLDSQAPENGRMSANWALLQKGAADFRAAIWHLHNIGNC